MNDLPVKKENFLAEIESMDLSPIKGEKFLVAIGTGDPNGPKMLSTTIHGPYDYAEMLQEVGDMWNTHQHHAKVVILDKDPKTVTRILDANTVDYIECHYNDLITEEMLGGAFDSKEFTCKAGLIDDDGSDPRHAKKEEPSIEDEELK